MLRFETHIENILFSCLLFSKSVVFYNILFCLYGQYKLHALQPIRKDLSTERSGLSCAFNLDDCRETGNFRSLEVVHNTYETTYDELLSINNYVSVH